MEISPNFNQGNMDGPVYLSNRIPAGMSSPQKIVLKSTTKISLNDRFSAYRKETSVTSIRQKMQMMRQASARNRRLAQQMENRPSVIAALKLKKRSLRQRLGQSSQNSIKARLSLGNRGLNRSFRGTNIGSVSNRGARFIQARGVLRRRNILQRRGARGFANNSTTSGALRSGTSPLIKARLGNQNTYLQTNRGNRRARGNRRNTGRRGNYSNRGNYQGQNFRNQRGSTRGVRNRGQFSGRRTRGGGRGRGRGGQQKNVPTKQELDNQLDEYMAKTKSYLDAEIDAYMSQATTE